MSAQTTRIAHLSDLHLLEPYPDRRRSYGLGVRFVSFGRRLDARERMAKTLRALDAAKRAAATHVVLSGDLTETGTQAQFEALAEVLVESKIAPEAITLVPGNHDAYHDPGGFQRALAGPLRRFAKHAAHGPGAVVERDDVCLLPLNVACHQPVTRSAGELRDEDARALERRLIDPTFRHRPLVVVQHHPPHPHDNAGWQWVDGLRGWPRALSMLARSPRSYVLHGHLHRAVNRPVAGGRDRVFGAAAVVDEREGAPRVRLYDVRDGALESAGLAA